MNISNKKIQIVHWHPPPPLQGEIKLFTKLKFLTAWYSRLFSFHYTFHFFIFMHVAQHDRSAISDKMLDVVGVGDEPCAVPHCGVDVFSMRW